MKTKIKNIFKDDLLKKGLSDSGYYTLANIGSKALGLLIIPILARSVSVEEFANYDLFLIISAFLQIFVILGIDSGIAILMVESKNDNIRLSFFYVSSLFISLSLLFVCSLLFGIIFLFVDELFLLSQDIWELIGLFILSNIINYHTFNFLRWREEAKKASFINLFAYFLGVTIGLSFLYFEETVYFYLLGLVIGSFIGSFFSLYIARKYIFQFKIIEGYKEQLKELFKLSLPFVPNYLGNNLMQMADRIVILMLFGKYELGLYAVIMRLAQIPQFIIGTISGGFLPVMYNNYKTKEGAKLIKNFFHFYLFIIPVSFVVFYLFSDWAVLMFGGEEYLVSAYLLPMALVSILFVNGTQSCGFGFTIKRKTHYIMYITFLSVFINFILSIGFGFWFGLAGVFLGTLIAGIIRVYMHMSYSEKLYSFGYSMKYFAVISILVFILSISSYIFKSSI